MKIDAHQHFWALARGDYDWLTPELGPIHRDFLPDDLEPLLMAAGIGGTILVQAAPTENETDFLLDIARRTGFVKGVVGWTDFEAPGAAARIARLGRDPLVVGLRPMIQDIGDPDWMLRETLTPAFAALTEAGLTFDALTLPDHLPRLRRLLARHPGMRVVIDHGSKPEIRDGRIDDWKAEMTALGRDSAAWVKLSGLVTEAAADWTEEDLRPYVEHLLEAFGPERLIWGSDWPVCTLASPYTRWLEVTDRLLSGLSEAEREAIYGGNAARAYRLAR